MCTVTFIPRDVGYYLAMNRDEQLKRIAGIPPQPRIVNDRTILCPSEPGGGTWISLNDLRVCFALINWYSVRPRVEGKTVSRGEVVNAVASSHSADEAANRLSGLLLGQMNPFRLIGIFPGSHAVIEWCWDLRRLIRKEHPWRAQQWISSGYDEPTAQAMRSAAFQQAQRDKSPETLAWLRRLHSSHAPNRGPFSTCMHRTEAATVSYTEVSVSADAGSMKYQSGSPCLNPQHSASGFVECSITSPQHCS